MTFSTPMGIDLFWDEDPLPHGGVWVDTPRPTPVPPREAVASTLPSAPARVTHPTNELIRRVFERGR